MKGIHRHHFPTYFFSHSLPQQIIFRSTPHTCHVFESDALGKGGPLLPDARKVFPPVLPLLSPNPTRHRGPINSGLHQVSLSRVRCRISVPSPLEISVSPPAHNRIYTRSEINPSPIADPHLKSRACKPCPELRSRTRGRSDPKASTPPIPMLKPFPIPQRNPRS